MFTEPRPQFVPPTVPPTATIAMVDDVLGDGQKTKKGGNLQKLRALATRPLKPTGQPKTLVGMEHFFSGLLLGAGVVVATVVTGVVLGRRTWVGWGRG